ncbi:EF-hand domain-containing protein 1-like isoform X2 [Cylas formicarius]|uniref:EF-hand domain-containing protein 1-like isoform X2 n=1 Tax=Cylas formicarius TaxID=197179 RepID=UPI002958ADC4|nr:EF-hand domain-containing protein 1-like isoform X2 [Cylas formicarius]
MNSGLEQGRLIRRAKLLKYNDGTYWHWTDFAVGRDMCFYGTVYHIVDCDLFTREYMASQGLDMSEPEEIPYDPYIYNRELKVKPHVTSTPSAHDKLRRFLEYDGKILKFKAVWDDRENEYGELMKFEILYFLSDDTVLVRNVLQANSGRDPYPILLRKTKLPKIYSATPVTYPSLYLEKTEAEVTEFYQPKDFLIGSTIFVLGRDMLLYDCDKFTREYFKNALGIEQKSAIDIEEPKKTILAPPVPAHDGLGSLEDSLQNTLTFMPKAPKKNVTRQLLNANKFLRYEMVMDAVHSEDSTRRFILSYSLAEGTCKIHEPPVKNSGIIGGKYLRNTLLAKPGSDPLNPDLYTPADFYIGAIIIVFGQRFKITGADLYVYRYMQENCSKFPCEVIENMRNYMCGRGYLKDDIDDLIKDNLAEEKKDDDVNDELQIQKRVSDYQDCTASTNLTVPNRNIKHTDDKNYCEENTKVIHEYDDSISQHATDPSNQKCKYPVHVGEPKDMKCDEDIEGQYTFYTPKHIDTPEEVIQKYYARVLREHQNICNTEDPIECVEYKPTEKDLLRAVEQKPYPLMVNPPDIKSETCKYKKKVVQFASDRCQQDANYVCDINTEKDNCDCTNYKKECL